MALPCDLLASRTRTTSSFSVLIDDKVASQFDDARRDDEASPDNGVFEFAMPKTFIFGDGATNAGGDTSTWRRISFSVLAGSDGTSARQGAAPSISGSR